MSRNARGIGLVTHLKRVTNPILLAFVLPGLNKRLHAALGLQIIRCSGVFLL